MKVYVARENALEFDLEDVMLGVYLTKEAAMQSCMDQKEAWESTWDDYTISDSGWVDYNEISAGGWTRETNVGLLKDNDPSVDHYPTATLFHYVYEMEVE